MSISGGISASSSAPVNQFLERWNLNGYLFDAWLEMTHNSSLTITEHPVQTGAAITDHSYINPRKFMFKLGITDVARAINAAGAKSIGASPTRTFNAFEILRNLQYSRRPLYLVSKYGLFQNILIEDIDIPDDWTTQKALKATVTLKEIILANVSTITVNGLPELVDQTERGQATGRPPNNTIARDIAVQYGIPQNEIIPVN